MPCFKIYIIFDILPSIRTSTRPGLYNILSIKNVSKIKTKNFSFDNFILKKLSNKGDLRYHGTQIRIC